MTDIDKLWGELKGSRIILRDDDNDAEGVEKVALTKSDLSVLVERVRGEAVEKLIGILEPIESWVKLIAITAGSENAEANLRCKENALKRISDALKEAR